MHMKRSKRRHGAADVTAELHADAESLRKSVSSDDYSTSAHAIVPLDQRKPLWHFVGLWTTFMVGFIYILEGVEIYSAGYSLPACVGLSILGCFVYFLYAIFAAYLGSRTGQTHSLPTRSIYGISGSYVVAALLIIPPLASTGFQAGLMVQIWHGLYGWHAVEFLTILFSALMVFNNLFGFSGISVFARYVVTPAMLLWATWMVAKGFIDGSHLGAHPKNSAGLTLWQIIGIAIGAGVWGNEPDIWRYSKPRLSWAAIAFGFALFVAGTLFVLAGWMMAAQSGSTDFSHIVNFTTHYSLFGLLPLAFFLGTVAQIALNDGNYYQAITAFQNVFGGWSKWKRLYSCMICLVIAGVAGWYVNYGSTNGLVLITGLASITLPCATVIMVVDHFVLPRVLGISRPLLKVPAWGETGVGNLPAIVALVVAVVFGCIATGTIPQAPHRYWVRQPRSPGR
jgi:purine-cytosine permease-like protein